MGDPVKVWQFWLIWAVAAWVAYRALPRGNGRLALGLLFLVWPFIW